METDRLALGVATPAPFPHVQSKPVGLDMRTTDEMSDTPWFKFYPSDWLSGTRGLTAIETGIYITLIAMMYDHAEPLSMDHKRLSRMCGATPRQFASAFDTLTASGKIENTREGIWNARVAQELQNRRARIGNAKRANTASQTAKDKENQCDEFQSAPQNTHGSAATIRSQKSEPESKKEKENLTVLPKEKRGTRIPDDFLPDATCQALAETLLMDISQSQAAFDNFMDYWRGVPGQRGCKLDWQATFRNWLRNGNHGKGKPNGKAPGHHTRADVFAALDAVADEAKRRQAAGSS